MNISRIRKRRSKPVPVDPEQQLLLEELCETLQKLGVDIRQESGNFTSGLCVVEGKETFFLNKKIQIEQNIEILTSQIRSMDIEGIYLSPKLRIHLDENEISVGG